MALRFLQAIHHPLEKMTASVLYRHSAGAKKSAAGVTLPEKPKKPLSGYVTFLTNTLPKLKTKMPGARSADMMVKASQLWKDLEPSERKRYNDDYAERRNKWTTEMAAFEASLSDQSRAQLAAAERRQREARRDERDRRDRRRELADLDRPRRPPNAFMLFFLERRHTRGDTPMKEFVVNMGKQWAAMSEEDKFPYVKRFQDTKEKYDKDLEAWEKRMIKEGRADLVRRGSQPVVDAEEAAGPRRR